MNNKKTTQCDYVTGPQLGKDTMPEYNCECSNHEDFPNTIDGKEVAEEVEVFPLECPGVLNSLLKIRKDGFKE